MKRWFGVCAILIATVIWGSAFVAQYIGSESLPPLAFTSARSFIGALAVLPLALFSVGKEKRVGAVRNKIQLWIGGIVCGGALCAASALQQAGIAQAGASKAGFITVLYVVLVPLIGIFVGRKASLPLWLCAVGALFGSYLLSITEGFVLQTGDLLLLGCALMYAVQILLVDRFVARANALMLSCLQLFFAGVFSLIASLVVERATFAMLLDGLLPLLYVGVLSSGIAYTLQMVGQKFLPPALATLLMSLESVFALLSGWLILDERLSLRQLIGCGIVLLSVITAQLTEKKRA